MKFVESFVREITNPSKGVRLPSELGTQRTALLPQHTNTRVAVQGSTIDLVMTRDTLYPLWGETNFDTNATSKTWNYGATWAAESRNVSEQMFGGGSAVQESRLITDFDLYDLSDGDIPDGAQGWYCDQDACPVGAVLAKMPDVDDKPWIYVPNGVTLAIAVGFGSYTAAASPNVTPTVVIEQAIGPSKVVGTSEEALGDIAPLKSSVGVLGDWGHAKGSKGVWLRPVELRLKKAASAAGVTMASDWRPMISLYVIGCKVEDAIYTAPLSSDGDFPSVSCPVGKTVPAFMPLINMSMQRKLMTYSNDIILDANRMVGVSLMIENTTSVMNMEGELLATCFNEGPKGTVLDPPSDSVRASILDRDKLSTRLANSVFSFVRPGREIARFQDSTTDYYNSNVVVKNPVMNLYKLAAYNLLSIRDLSSAAPSFLLLTLRTCVEFQCDDVLLRPMWANGTLADLQSAVNRVHSIPPFRVMPRGAPNGLVNYSPLGAKPGDRGRRPRRKRQPNPRQRIAQPARAPAPKPQAKRAPVGPNGRQHGLDMFLAKNKAR